MATTTNYGWTTPDDTALVKDGAAAIRSLGSSIDTTTKNLNPSTTLGDLEYRSSTANTNTRIPIGTSGQGLQVVAGVPAWAASSTSTLTTTGDILYASAANTLARRAIGSTGDVLTVSGGLPTWVAPSSGAYTLLSTTSLTGATTTISSINQTYTDLKIVIYGVSNATADGLFRCAPNGTTNIASFLWYGDFGGSFSTQGQFGNNNYVMFSANSGLIRTSTSNSWEFFISNYSSTVASKPYRVSGRFEDASGTNRPAFWMGGINTTSAITSLVFSNAGGNLSTGTVLIYGVK